MFLSVFEIFKIGVGPSSSHTMGPMTAAAQFVEALAARTPEPGAGRPARIRARLLGSLAFTGRGHATDRAVRLGLLGFTPATADPDACDAALVALADRRAVPAADGAEIAFDPELDVAFDYETPATAHPNTMVLAAFDDVGNLVLEERYCSVGGGFVLTEAEVLSSADDGPEAPSADTPYPFRTAAEMLSMSAESGRSIAAMKRLNEVAALAADRGLDRAAAEQALDDGLDAIWGAMNGCLERGLSVDGELPGGLKVRRRAKAVREALEAEWGRNDRAPHIVNDWISLYAMAVNEENAAGGRVVTAPTNGAAGVVPATIRYYLDHAPTPDRAEKTRRVRDFLLVAAAIGGVVKTNASISGAEVGCQGEVGSAAAMAAAGLCAVFGGSAEQVENAAEIALEHHLGMTCDPVGGLVQVPCIERNGLGAVKAVTAASLALRGDGRHFMPLDNCIEAMRQTGLDMNDRYKETSQGGLAVNMPEC